MTNPFNTIETADATYEANPSELVLTRGEAVVLPNPTDSETVLVRAVDQTVEVTAASGTVEGNDEGFVDTAEGVLFVSDGQDWYVYDYPGAFVKKPELDHYWLMDEGSGSTAADSEGNIDITLSGAGWSSYNGHGGYVTAYDGSGDYFESANLEDASPPNFAVYNWFKLDSAPDDWARIFRGTEKSASTSGDGWEFYWDPDNEIRLGINGTGVITTDINVSLNTWYMIGLTADDDNGDLYIYDRHTQIFADSWSEERSSNEDAPISGMGDSDPRYIEGEVGEIGMSSTTTFTNQQFNDIWQITR